MTTEGHVTYQSTVRLFGCCFPGMTSLLAKSKQIITCALLDPFF